MAGPGVHRCWHPDCHTFASFGRDVFRGQEGEWSCREHLWPDYFSRRAVPAALLEPIGRSATLPPSPAPRQGRLL